ncbi:hypothetical protein ACFE04_030133 [Oxalis oulophora]
MTFRSKNTNYTVELKAQTIDESTRTLRNARIFPRGRITHLLQFILDKMVKQARISMAKVEPEPSNVQIDQRFVAILDQGLYLRGRKNTINLFPNLRKWSQQPSSHKESTFLPTLRKKDRGAHKINKRSSSSSALLKTVRELETYIKMAKEETELMLNEETKSLANALESAAHAERELKKDLAQRKLALADLQDALLEVLEDCVVSFLG